MAEDIMGAIGLLSESLLGKLVGNHELCSNVMALAAVVAIEMNGNKASAIHFSSVEMNGRQMKSRVSFEFTGRPAMAVDIPDSHKLIEHIGQENRMFYEFLRAHPGAVRWLRQVVEKMETYAIQKGVPYASLSFGDNGAFVDPGNWIVLELTA